MAALRADRPSTLDDVHGETAAGGTLEIPLADLPITDLAALDLVLLAMIIAYGRISRLAAALLLPYFGWLLFATALNIWIVKSNP